jgi:hypothetical protein
VKIKSRNETLNDIIRDSKKYPKGWKAAFGKDDKLFSHDYYIFNPNIGIYLLKEYQKNPYNVKGLGTKIARHIDEDIQEKISEKSGDFGIIQGNIKKIVKNIDRGIDPQKIFEEGLKGRDLGIRMPVRGKASTSKDAFDHLQEAFSSKQKRLNSKLEKMISDDGIYSSYG